tara:strand:+ start:15694 stop:17334 length:1641 start_codon:yes stop_codon:yes gene_type:complete
MKLNGWTTPFLAGLLAAGCSTMERVPDERPDKPLSRVRKNQKVEPGESGLQIIRYVDEQGRERTMYIYVPRGVPRTLIDAINDQQVAKVLELASKERETNTRAALFGARWVSKRTHSKYAPDGFILTGEIYEDMGLHGYAFSSYNEMVSRWPGHQRRLEIMERQLAIADKFKDGQASYKWKIPWQDSVAIPIPRWFTHGRTPKLYDQIVENAPYGPLAAAAQFRAGQAHENAMGFWGGPDRYKDAVAAYQLAADRYGRREMKADNETLQTAEEIADRAMKALDADGDGKLTSTANPDVFKWHGFTTQETSDNVITRDELVAMYRKQEEQAARARYHIGKVLESRASDGLYDQTLAEKSIAAYQVFLNYYGIKNDQSRYVPREGFEDEWFQESIPLAESSIDAMRLEQANGLVAIAEFYEFRKQWTAAQKYYSEVIRVTQSKMQGDLDTTRLEIYDDANAALDQLYRKRIEAAVADHDAAAAAELAGRYYTALRLYRSAHVGLSLSSEDLDKYAPAYTSDALRIRTRTVEDMRRMDEVIARQTAGSL